MVASLLIGSSLLEVAAIGGANPGGSGLDCGDRVWVRCRVTLIDQGRDLARS